MRYRAVLVENEEHSLSRLRRLLQEFSDDIEIVGEAMDGPSAVETLRIHAPDLVFLDIDLPGFHGFAVLEKLERQPAVIFTTALEQHALEAFKTHAVDYLLKPIDAAAIGRALKKLRAMGIGSDVSRVLQQLRDAPSTSLSTRLSCKVAERTFLLDTSEIMYFRAEHKYTTVYTATRELLIETPLVGLESKLKPRDFVRIHRSTLVNVAWIAEIVRASDGKLSVILKDASKTELVASRIYADNLRNL